MEASSVRAEVRSVLSRNRLELSALRVGVFGRVVRLQGELRRVAGLPDLTHEALESLEQELRRISGVQRVELHLANWRRENERWQLLAAQFHDELETPAVPTPVVCS